MKLEDFKTIRDVFLDYYPDERIDIRPSSYLAEAFALEAEGKEIHSDLEAQIKHHSSLSIVIHYPELVITNSRNGSHYTIYGLYAQFEFPGYYIKLGRTDYTSQELYAGYRHSHIQTFNQLSMTPFCTGSSNTPINKILSIINTEKYKQDLATTVMSLILVWEESIRTESSEGGPYIYFANVSSLTKDTPITIPEAILPNCLVIYNKRMTAKITDFINYYCSLGLDKFYYDGRSWQLQDSDAEFIKRVTKVARTYSKTGSTSCGIYMPVFKKDGLYYESSSYNRNISIASGDKVYWTFKNKKPEIRILESQEEVKPEYIVNPTLLSILYTFLITLANTIYAKSNKDNLLSRTRKISLALVKSMRGQDTDGL